MDLINFSADLPGVTRKSFGEQFHRVIIELQVEGITVQQSRREWLPERHPSLDDRL